MKKKKQNEVLKFLIIFTIVGLMVFCTTFMLKLYKEQMDDETKEVIYTEYEITTEAKGYVILNENVVNYDQNLRFVPLATPNLRILKGSFLGVYKNSEYDEKLKKLGKLDDEINQKLLTLTEEYSNDVAIIQSKIDAIVKESGKIEGIIGLSNYKLQLDELLYEKALTIAKLTPSGDEVTKLIDERNMFYEAMNNTGKNIKSPVSGVVVYQNDGLENKYNLHQIKDIDNIEKMIEEYNTNTNMQFGVKIVDNYESYIVIKDDKSNDKYANVGYYYDIEMIDLSAKLRAQLVDKISTTTENYYVFKSTNNIEKYVDKRVINLKIIFKKLEAFEVSNESIYEKDEINYIKIHSLNEYVEIPIKLEFKLSDISYINNYTQEEKKQRKIQEKRDLLMYDRVVLAPN